ASGWRAGSMTRFTQILAQSVNHPFGGLPAHAKAPGRAAIAARYRGSPRGSASRAGSDDLDRGAGMRRVPRMEDQPLLDLVPIPGVDTAARGGDAHPVDAHAEIGVVDDPVAVCVRRHVPAPLPLVHPPDDRVGHAV